MRLQLPVSLQLRSRSVHWLLVVELLTCCETLESADCLRLRAGLAQIKWTASALLRSDTTAVLLVKHCDKLMECVEVGRDEVLNDRSALLLPRGVDRVPWVPAPVSWVVMVDNGRSRAKAVEGR